MISNMELEFYNMNDEMIERIKKEVVILIKDFMGSDLIEAVLYGSCARGDYTADSDVDIALITGSDRLEAKKYGDFLADVATKLAMKYHTVVNFVCIPYDEFLEKRGWFTFFRNIQNEGEIIYG